MEESKRLRLKLTTATEVRRALTRVSNMVLNGELDPKRANAIILACNAILSSIRTDEQGKKMAELEELLAELKRTKTYYKKEKPCKIAYVNRKISKENGK